MINITSIKFDILGALTLQENEQKTSFGKASRRQNRVPTLDGLSVLQDRGYSPSDLTFNIVVKKYLQPDFDRLRSFIEAEPLVRMSCRLGDFVGTLSSLDDESSSFNFLVIRVG